jgi:hypothetical protein
MTWLTWRQHRAEAAAALLLVGCLGMALYLTGLPAHTSFAHDSVGACLTQRTATCAAVIERFRTAFGGVQTLLLTLNVVPAVIGAFLGAPLVAREFEAGTWQLAWTQAVPRLRWLTVKLATLATVTVVLNIAFAALLTWYRQPYDALDGRFAPNGFDLEGVMPPTYALFAFTAGTAAGALIRRSVPALAVTLAAFAGTRFFVETRLRPRFRTPVTAVWDPITQPGMVGRGGWALDYGIVDAQGHHVSYTDSYFDAYKAALAEHVDVPTYVHLHGLHLWNTYQPADRFWTFQFIEAAIYLCLAAALFALVAWRVRRRTA